MAATASRALSRTTPTSSRAPSRSPPTTSGATRAGRHHGRRAPISRTTTPTGSAGSMTEPDQTTFRFTLILEGPDVVEDHELLDRFFEAGCDDALFGMSD